MPTPTISVLTLPNPTITTVKSGKLRASYISHDISSIDGIYLSLTNYEQQDSHSCAFIAALTVVRYLGLEVTDEEILKAVRPTTRGVDGSELVTALEKLGINANYTENLSVAKLIDYTEQAIPVIISVWPDEWDTDHWTIVRGFDDTHIHLVNHTRLPYKLFKKQWIHNYEDGSKTGAGLVCTLN